jgi:hypothetical protein
MCGQSRHPAPADSQELLFQKAKLSATTALVPPGPMSLAMVVNGCAMRIRKSVTARQDREGWLVGQDCSDGRFLREN